MRAGLIIVLVLIVAAAVVALNSLFIVTPTQQALVLQFGEVKQAIRDPGLNTKIPLVQQVHFLDRRNLDLDVPAQEIIAADQKRLVVDAFMRWRIANPVRFYQTVTTVPQGEQRLQTFVSSAVRTVLADATFTDIVRDNRAQIMQRISERVAGNARDIGVEVVDVKIRRADLPEANSDAIFQRMQTERQQEAREIRAQGEEAALRVRAAADRTATVLRAEAERESQQIRGQGDAQRSAIFAQAYSLDPDFFAFYRAMQAYRLGLGASDTRLVLSPDTDFFRFFNTPAGRGTPGQGSMELPTGLAPDGGSDEMSTLSPGSAPDGTEADAANVTIIPPEGTGTGSNGIQRAPSPAGGTLGATAEESAVESAVRDELAPVDASNAAAIITADPQPSAAANAAAAGVAGSGPVAPEEVRPVQEGAVTIVEQPAPETTRTE